MPHLWPGRRSRKYRPVLDVTISDSANARQPVARISKSRATSSNMSSQSDVPDNWEDCADQPPADEVEFTPMHELGRVTSCGGIRYPPELWYLIGRHVAPEDVAVFAAICRDAYRTTLTHPFWVRLYWRFCAPPPPLTALVTPDWLQERRGCRAAVVRALHRLHEPLLTRVRRRATDGAETSRLVGATCCTLGRCRSSGDAWFYCFIFRRRARNFHRRLAPVGRRDVSAAREQLFSNDDEGLAGLVVRAPATSQLPAVFGHVLQSVTVTMTTGMQMKLNMVFTQTGYREGGSKTPASYLTRSLVLAPVKSLRLVHWWEEEFHDIFHRHMIAGKFGS